MPPERRRRRLPVGAAAVVLALGLLAPAAEAAPAGRSGTAADPVAAVEQTGEEPIEDDTRPQLPEPEVSTEEANQQADEILADPKYDPPPESLLDRFFRWLGEQLDGLLPDGVLPGGGGGEVVGWLLLFALAVLAAFLLSRTRFSRRRRADEEPDFLVDDEVSRPQHEWISEAERFEAEGQWKQALRCRFRALVGALIDRGVVRDIPGRTTGEYRVEVARNAPAVTGPFAGAAELFDRAWYGDQPTGPDENQRFRALADEVVLGVEAAEAARDRATSAEVGS